MSTKGIARADVDLDALRSKWSKPTSSSSGDVQAASERRDSSTRLGGELYSTCGLLLYTALYEYYRRAYVRVELAIDSTVAVLI